MGMDSYRYVIDYKDNIANALEKLQQQIFADGDYRHSENGYDSIDDARNDAAEDGTGSALDIYGISSVPQPACLTPLKEEELLQYFGTVQLEVNDVERINQHEEFWGSIGRGEARLITLYDSKGTATKYYIAGFSFD